MLKRNGITLTAILLCMAVCSGQTGNSFAKDKIKPEQLVEEHLKAIGTPEAQERIKTRLIIGLSTMKYITGGSGQLAGKANWASEKGKMGLVIQFGARDYPGEHFAYDGNDVMVDYIQTGGQRSPIGNFLLNYEGLIKNGIFGGVLNLNWPLLDTGESKSKMNIKTKKIDDRELYEVEFRPKGSMEDVKVKLYFDPETYRHVMTEYRLRKVSMGGSLSSNAESTTNYLLVEKFEDFEAVDGITLPHKYSLTYELQGRSSLQVLYTFDADQIGHNGPIDARFYIAQK